MTIADVALASYTVRGAELRLEARAESDDKVRAAKNDAADACLNAARAERDDPDPRRKDAPWCQCQACQAWLFAAHWQRMKHGWSLP